MNCSELDTTQPITNIDWDDALNCYENILKCGDEPLILKATIKFACLVNRAPEDILARSISVLVELFRRHLYKSNWSICVAVMICVKRAACIGEGKLAEIIDVVG